MATGGPVSGEFDAHVFETLILQLLFLCWKVGEIYCMFSVIVEYLLCSYMVFKE